MELKDFFDFGTIKNWYYNPTTKIFTIVLDVAETQPLQTDAAIKHVVIHFNGIEYIELSQFLQTDDRDVIALNYYEFSNYCNNSIVGEFVNVKINPQSVSSSLSNYIVRRMFHPCSFSIGKFSHYTGNPLVFYLEHSFKDEFTTELYLQYSDCKIEFIKRVDFKNNEKLKEEIVKLAVQWKNTNTAANYLAIENIAFELIVEYLYSCNFYFSNYNNEAILNKDVNALNVENMNVVYHEIKTEVQENMYPFEVKDLFTFYTNNFLIN